MRYIVTAERPTNCRGDRAKFNKGDVIEIRDGARTDSDDDYRAVRVSDGTEDYIFENDIRPEGGEKILLDAVKAALAVKGVENADEIIALARAIEGAL